MTDEQDMKNTLPKPFLFILSLWAVVLFLYMPAYKAGFWLQDFVDMVQLYQRQSFLENIGRNGTAPLSLYQVTRAIQFLLLSVFKFHPLPWFFLFTLFHALNGYLIYKFCCRFFFLLGYTTYHKYASLAGVLLFLISPIQVEVVTWKVCFHYLSGVFMIFLILNWLLSYIETEKKNYLYYIWTLYCISTFTLEIFYLTPAFVITVIISFYLKDLLSFSKARQLFINTAIPLILIWIGYISLYYFSYGDWQAHYKQDIGSPFHPNVAFWKLSRYISRTLFLDFLWPTGAKNFWYHLLQSKALVWIFGIGVLCFFIWGWARYKKLQNSVSVLYALFIFTLLSIILIIPFWFGDMFMVRNDRFYYLPSVFLYQFIAVLLFSIRSIKISRIIIPGYIMLFVIGACYVIISVRAAQKIQMGMMNNFRWQNAKQVLLLNLPCTYNGIGIEPSTQPSNFNFYLNIFGKDSVKGKIYDVAGYNVQEFWNGAHVTVQDSLTLKVTMNQLGSWWWQGEFGALDYENDIYSAKFTGFANEYLLTFKQKPDTGTVILYQQGDQWRRVDMNKLGQEQW